MNNKSYIDWYSMNDKSLSETIGDFVGHHRQWKEVILWLL